MIDLKALRNDPERFRRGAADKRMEADLDALLEADARLRELMTRQQDLVAEKNKIGKEIGKLAGRLKKVKSLPGRGRRESHLPAGEENSA